MVEHHFIYQTEYYSKEGKYVPLLSCSSSISDYFSFTNIAAPKRFSKKKLGDFELSRQERLQRAKRLVLERFKRRFAKANFPGSTYAVAFLEEKIRKGLTASTIRSSGCVVFLFLRFIDSTGGKLENMSRKDIHAFVEHEQDQGNKIVTIKAKLRVLYPFLSYLVDREIVDPSSLKNKIQVKLPDPLPRSIEDDDIEQLLTVLNEPLEKAIILILLRTGIRIGELLELKVSDVNLHEKKIMVFLGEKNFQGRVVFFSDDAKEALLSWMKVRQPERKYLFYGRGGAPLSYSTAWRCIKKCFKRARLSHKGYSPHCLRHTFATKALNAGMRLEVVQQLLGHLSIEVTLHYARLTDKTREDEYFRAMTKIEQGGNAHEYNRLNSQLQAAFKKKKLLSSHG